MGRRLYYAACLVYAAASLWLGVSVVGPALDRALGAVTSPAPAVDVTTSMEGVPASSGAAWFREMKPFCNAVEVETRVRQRPAPASLDGTAHEAACFALAGRVDRARALLWSLPEDSRWRGAGVVFNIGHPVADAGDDRSAGPLMELVVEFWPNHAMALYHAGAALFETGEREAARPYLERFLESYAVDDGWRGSALGMLEASPQPPPPAR